ncbi:19154_t:CDS:2 [Cetraspora pellucida]|uniref:19154_t:CDS:1 n=1 Tax=Cetraspora pellucida TaxID=1433469 RepID=A0A9N9NG27_9GLOM|nr:19154_t:CDS:2 [Cetraspora pellucida]
MKTRSMTRQELRLRRSKFLCLPPEIFIQICAHLLPKDLASLLRVCKQLYNELSIVEPSSTIQKIWKQSRLRFMPLRILDPPKGMSEQEYIKLLIEKKCSLCGKKSRKSKIYWDVKVRACESCYEGGTVTGIELFYFNYSACEIITCIPFTNIRGDSKSYWRFLVEAKLKEYKSLRGIERYHWVYEQTKQTEEIQSEVTKRWREDYSNSKNDFKYDSFNI